jgi:hypothetical protein
MAGDDKRVVWILGAGFSVPLGGPLFRGLISKEMHRTLTNWRLYARQTHAVSAPIAGNAQRIDVNAVAFGSIISEVYPRLEFTNCEPRTSLQCSSATGSSGAPQTWRAWPSDPSTLSNGRRRP